VILAYHQQMMSLMDKGELTPASMKEVFDKQAAMNAEVLQAADHPEDPPARPGPDLTAWELPRRSSTRLWPIPDLRRPARSRADSGRTMRHAITAEGAFHAHDTQRLLRRR
jgi:hypothetical protein